MIRLRGARRAEAALDYKTRCAGAFRYLRQSRIRTTRHARITWTSSQQTSLWMIKEIRSYRLGTERSAPVHASTRSKWRMGCGGGTRYYPEAGVYAVPRTNAGKPPKGPAGMERFSRVE